MSATLSGAREGRSSPLRRLLSRVAARELDAFVVPGEEVARAYGLDLASAGLRAASTPRHASVLVVVGELPEGMRAAAAVAFAQMPRPRAVLAVDAPEAAPLPGPDVSVEAGQEAFARGVAGLRRRFAGGAFAPEAPHFDPDALRARTVYTCSMHPEVVEEEPGTCPKCGMELVSREAVGDETGADGGEGHGESHGEREGDAGGGGDREPDEHEDGGEGHEEEGEDHGDMDHGDMDFMSMVEMTQGTPRSSDGLQMEWVEAPFGPFFPGLPGGLSLSFTLDGDTVAEAEAGSVAGTAGEMGGPVRRFVERVAGLDPLSPLHYRMLALRAVEDAAGAEVGEELVIARAGALERERAASHLNWLAAFARVVGYPWLARRAERLHLALGRAEPGGLDGLRREVLALARRVERTPLLRRKLAGTGALADPGGASGPVARACGRPDDLRAGEEVYASLGFKPAVEREGDALARLRVRLAEAARSLELARRTEAAGTDPLAPLAGDAYTGEGEARAETPRGAAVLRVTLEDGEVVAAELETPSARHLPLVGAVAEAREVGDALVGVASLDLSPWGIPLRGARG